MKSLLRFAAAAAVALAIAAGISFALAHRPGSPHPTGSSAVASMGAHGESGSGDGSSRVTESGYRLKTLPVVTKVVLAVQETPDAAKGRAKQRARDRGMKMLDFLEEIRIGLLMGVIPKDRLEQLAQMVRAKREQIEDPALTAILDEIELRAAVELAKLSR